MGEVGGAGTVFSPGSGTNDKRFSRLDLIFHAVTFSLDNEGFGMMEKAVKDGGSEGVVIVEDFGPVFKSTIGSKNQSALLIAEAEDLEQEISTCLVNGNGVKSALDSPWNMRVE